jgi:hypothetical protein
VLSFPLSNNNPTKEAVIWTFLLSMDKIGSHMVDLRKEAEMSMDHLMRLEDHLIVLGRSTLYNQREVLAGLWARLGWDLNRRWRLDNILNFVTDLEKWRSRALECAVATLQTTRALDADMDELRTRVAAPDIVGDKLPIDVHIKTIKAGTDRLKEGQMRAISRERGTTA